uniref:Receptor-like serine/threonine-protein kinase n=1 Tax=Manihot esculenta TaxID=3983 RepID=A0A2C9WJ33_MANES
MEVHKLLFLSPLFLLQSLFAASENITLSSSLFANDNSTPWLSPSGDFAFGFQKLKNTNLFLLAIWFDRIPDKTIVWRANGDNQARQGSKLKITAKGLVLSDPSGQQIWTSGINQTSAASYGAMLDTGNFVIVGSNSDHLWESFKNPTDTILPSQTLEPGTALFSSLSETNFSRGRFHLYFSNGDLQLSPLAWPTVFQYNPYFSSGTSANGSQLVFNESSNIYLLQSNGTIVELPWQSQNAAPSVAGNYYRATLDYNGVFTRYAYPRGSDGEQSWSIVQYIPENICSAIFNDLGSGACGYNSYCSLSNGRPNCTCPIGYSLMDQNNPFGGCKPKFPLGCGVDEASENLEELHELQELKNVNWPLGDYERLQPYSEEQCRTSCLQDCMCNVAIFGNSICWKKRVPLGSLSSSLALNAFLLIIVTLIFLLKQKWKPNGRVEVSSVLLETNLYVFTYKELEEATNNFKEQVGKGSSAIVYKGILNFAENKAIAVKKLDKLSHEADKEFRNQLKAIGKTCHKNLVRLLGFCEEGAHRLLVYEFMTNGTLANFLLGVPKPGWNIRAKIALEIARGLVYLHEECEVPIIHCGIKPENILLDELFTARISDFGLVKLLLTNQSRTMTNIRGTRGYVAPEWFGNVPITAKVDAYSFGVMLLEIICCRKNVSKLENEEILTNWVSDCFVEGRIADVIEFDKERVTGWVKVAMWCIQENPSKRPSMKMALQMLEGLVEVALPPICIFSHSYSDFDSLPS